MTPSKAESDLLANPGVRPTTYALGRAYGVTIFGAEGPPGDFMTPAEVRAQDPGVAVPPALEPLADDLRHRGLRVEHFWRPWRALSVDQRLEATLNDHPFTIIVRISTMHREPLALEIADDGDRREGPYHGRSAFVRSHSTTHERLLHTVDVFLAGIRAAGL